MDKDLEILHNLFLTDSYQREHVHQIPFFAFLNEINLIYGLQIKEDENAVKNVVNHIYFNDNIQLLKTLLEQEFTFAQGFNIYAVPGVFSSNQHLEIDPFLGDGWGEDGFETYLIKTKNRAFKFRSQRWGDGTLEFVGKGVN